MPPEERQQPGYLDRICEIAARLNEDAAMLRRLGLHEAARLLSAAEEHLDRSVYANGHQYLPGAGLLPEAPRGRRVKPRSPSH